MQESIKEHMDIAESSLNGIEKTLDKRSQQSLLLASIAASLIAANKIEIYKLRQNGDSVGL